MRSYIRSQLLLSNNTKENTCEEPTLAYLAEELFDALCIMLSDPNTSSVVPLVTVVTASVTEHSIKDGTNVEFHLNRISLEFSNTNRI